MAAVARQRRHLNLLLPLPPRSLPTPLPPLSNVAAASAATTTAATFSSDDFEKIEVLGHGNSGKVYKVRHRPTSQLYALKLVPASTDPVLLRNLRRETDILRLVKDCPYIVNCYHSNPTPSGDVAMLMEYMEMGSLDTVLKQKGTFTESELKRVVVHALHGIEFLHEKKIVHRDIKPANLLVNEKMEIKIADFGVSKMMVRSLSACNSYVGTCAYMSPERFDPDSYGGDYDVYAGDIWSLGLTLLELFLGRFPLLSPGQRPDWATLMCAICLENEPLSLPETASDEFKGFIRCCLEKESGKRWTATQLLSHPFCSGP